MNEAEQAFKQDRLQKASWLIREGNLQQYLPGHRLAANVAAALIDRAREHSFKGDLRNGWRDLDDARSLGARADDYIDVEQRLLDQTLRDIEQDLASDHVDRAIRQIDQLERRQISGRQIRTYRKAAQRLLAAKEFSRQGRFADAEVQLEAASQLLPSVKSIDAQRSACRGSLQQSRKITDQLHQALTIDDWSRSLSLADQLLRLAPDSQLAWDTRRRASAKVEAMSAKFNRLEETHYWPGPIKRNMNLRLTPTTYLDKSETVVMKSSEPRFLLWVDAVGGYLVCLGNEVVIGQAVPDSNVQIPILGDVSRQHARLRREGDHYLIEPMAPVRVDGTDLRRTTELADQDEIALGPSVLLRFRRPHPLSATARLEFVSRHRTQPWADGVLLMAESCVLGPNWNNHIVCRDWSDDVVLYQQDQGLFCRGMQSLEIDGMAYEGTGPLTYNSRVSGEDFSMSLEEI